MSKIRTTKGGMKYFWCPGCQTHHGVYPTNTNLGQPHPEWDYNDNEDSPTFSPSILVTGYYKDEKRICHSFVMDGKIQFLDDCWHELKGQTVEMEDMEE